MAALPLATADFGCVCCAFVTRRECQCRVSVAGGKMPSFGPVPSEGNCGFGGKSGYRRGYSKAVNSFRMKIFFKGHVYLLPVGKEGFPIAVLRAASSYFSGPSGLPGPSLSLPRPRRGVSSSFSHVSLVPLGVARARVAGQRRGERANGVSSALRPRVPPRQG